MGLVAAKCTHCGAKIEVESSEEANICPVCGKAIVTKKAISCLLDKDGLIEKVENEDFQIVSGELKRYRGEADEVVVPDGITRLGNRAFSGLNVSSVVLPSSLTVIGKQAFRGCERLTRVIVPEGVVAIRDRAFDGCTALPSVTLPQSVREIGTACFCGCKSLTELILPSKLLSLGDGCFYGSGIEKIDVPGSLTELNGKSYFAYCSNLKSVNFCDGLKKLGHARYASFFQGCTLLKSVKLPKGLKYIGNGVFAFCEITKIAIPKSATEIGNNAFAHCERLKEISLPDSVKEIGSEAFQGCIELGEVKLPSRLQKLGYRAFSECSALKRISLPLLSLDGMNESFPEYLFEDSSIEFLEIPPDFPHGLNAVLDNVKSIGTLKGAAREINILSSSVTKRCSALIVTSGKLECRGLTNALSLICEDGVTAIGEGVFEDGEIEYVKLSDTITEIGARAFARCKKLRELSFPRSLATLGRDAISDCTELECVAAPQGLKKYLKPQIKKLESVTKRKISVTYFK